MRIAMLLCWDLYKSVKTVAGRQELTKTPEELAEILGFLAKHLEESNGSSFWKKQGGLVFAGDAGEAGSGGVIITRDLPRHVHISYTDEHLQRMASQEFHSTVKEVLNVMGTVQCLLETTATQGVGNMLS